MFLLTITETLCSNDCGCLRINGTVYLSTNYTQGIAAADGGSLEVLGTVDLTGIPLTSTNGITIYGTPTANTTVPVLVTSSSSLDGPTVIVRNLTIQGDGVHMATASPASVLIENVAFNCTTGTTASSGHVTSNLTIRDNTVDASCAVGFEYVVEGETYIDDNEVSTTSYALNISSVTLAVRDNTLSSAILYLASTTVADVSTNALTGDLTLVDSANSGLTVELNSGRHIILSGVETGLTGLICSQSYDNKYVDDLQGPRRLLNCNPGFDQVNASVADCVGTDCDAFYSGRSEECTVTISVDATDDGYLFRTDVNEVSADAVTSDFDTQERSLAAILVTGSHASRTVETETYPDGDNGWSKYGTYGYEGTFSVATLTDATNREGSDAATDSTHEDASQLGGFVCITRQTNDTEAVTCAACERYDIGEVEAMYALATSNRDGAVRIRDASTGSIEYSTCTARIAPSLYGNTTELTTPTIASEDCPGTIEVAEGTGEVAGCDGEGQVWTLSGDLNKCRVRVSYAVEVNGVARGTGHSVTIKAKAPAAVEEEPSETTSNALLIVLLAVGGTLLLVAIAGVVLGGLGTGYMRLDGTGSMMDVVTGKNN